MWASNRLAAPPPLAGRLNIHTFIKRKLVPPSSPTERNPDRSPYGDGQPSATRRSSDLSRELFDSSSDSVYVESGASVSRVVSRVASIFSLDKLIRTPSVSAPRRVSPRIVRRAFALMDELPPFYATLISARVKNVLESLAQPKPAKKFLPGGTANQSLSPWTHAAK